MASSRAYKFTSLKDVLKRFNTPRDKYPPPVDNPTSAVGYETITIALLKILGTRLDITNRQNNISDNYFRSSIQDYISRNKLSDENAKILTAHRYYIYLNHFLRVFEKKYDDKGFYELEYITDKTGNFNILNAKLFDVMYEIIKNRLFIEKIPFVSPRVSRLLVHGRPLAETFKVPDNLIICYSVPITYFGIMNLELLKLYEFIAKKYNNYVACPDLLQSPTHNSKYLQYFYPGQQIWNIFMGKDETEDNEMFGEFFYDTYTQHFIKEGTTDGFFEEYNGKKLSEYCIGKTGILFVDACRACNAGHGLDSQIVEFMCMYDTILKILNTIISEEIIRIFDSERPSYKNIAKDLQAIGNIEKKKLFDKKIQVTVNFNALYELVEILDGHKPFFDPFLSPNYDNSDTKRIYFNTEYPDLSPTNPKKKAGNEANIKQKIAQIPKPELFGDNITRNNILTLILNAITFHNNANNIKYLCDLLATRDNMHLIDKIINNSENITYYLFLNSEYRKYAIYLLVWYYNNKQFHDVLDDDSYYYLKILNEILLDVNDIKYTLDIKNKMGEWDMFFRVLMYNLIQYISDKTETDKFYDIYFQNVIKISELITNILSADIKRNIIKTFGITKFSDFFEKLSQDVLVKNYNDYITKQKKENSSKIQSKGGKKMIYKTFKNKHKRKHESKIKSTHKK